MDINDIVKGGDERIKLKDNGLHKYHGNPLIYESVFNRGSCTMSNLNLDSKRAVDKMLNRLKKDNNYDTIKMKDLIWGETMRFNKILLTILLAITFIFAANVSDVFASDANILVVHYYHYIIIIIIAVLVISIIGSP